MNGSVGILNVGAGDTKLTFDKNNPGECVRAARIVADMLKRGYMLLVDVDGDGQYTRAKGFDENTCEYIIADFDPLATPEIDDEEHDDEPIKKTAAKRKKKTKRVSAAKTKAVAVSKISGG